MSSDTNKKYFFKCYKYFKYLKKMFTNIKKKIKKYLKII